MELAVRAKHPIEQDEDHLVGLHCAGLVHSQSHSEEANSAAAIDIVVQH